ncbi:MAG: hypothetical protein JXX29_00965, partial [Deltaproteobacteria bacterium]|nr:hypothetical protein [Deltaproteobacteria bacterium]
MMEDSEKQLTALPEVVQTERQIALFKLVIAFIGMVVTTFWFLLQLETIRWFLFVSEGVFAIWAAVNFSVYFFHRNRKSASMVATLTTAFDVLVIAVLDVIVLMQTPFNFLNGPHVSLYFVVISTSSVRHNSVLVKQTGISCALVHLVIAFGCYLTHQIPFTFFVEST